MLIEKALSKLDVDTVARKVQASSLLMPVRKRPGLGMKCHKWIGNRKALSETAFLFVYRTTLLFSTETLMDQQATSHE